MPTIKRHHSIYSKRKVPFRLFVLLMIGLSIGSKAQIQLNALAPPFTLADQFGQQTTLLFPQKKPTVLIFADRGGRSQAQRWLQAIVKLPDVPQLLSVACTGWVPSVFQSSIRKAFLQSKPVLIDWNNTIANQYGYTGAVCRLIGISAAGNIIAIETGDYSSTRLAALTQSLR